MGGAAEEGWGDARAERQGQTVKDGNNAIGRFEP
jgi:hypothetical protein